MRRIGPFVLLSLLWCLFAGSIAKAEFVEPAHLFFTLEYDRPDFGSINGGTISYAGGTAPLVGSDLVVDNIVQEVGIGIGPDLRCLQCTLSFSTGPFAGTTAGDPPIDPLGYLFAGGGSLQIIGGTNNFDGTFTLPAGTVLLTGVPTGGGVDISGAGDTETGLQIQGTLNPQLASFYQFPVGASIQGFAGITTTVGQATNAPDAFILSGIESFSGVEPSHIFVTQSTQSVPVPDTLWPFAIGFVAVAVWWGRRKAVPL